MMNVTNLSVARGGVSVLEGVSFALAPGQALVLRGPNGVGKTSLLRVLAGLQPAAAGAVLGEVLGAGIAYAGHADGLKAGLTVEENLAFWADVNGMDGVAVALEAMNLGALRARRAGELSAGQKRRLGLARLLVTGRAVWLMDEPTVSLDTASVQLFAGVLRAHLSQGGAAVMATHIDLGLPEARVLDLTGFRAVVGPAGVFGEAFA